MPVPKDKYGIPTCYNLNKDRKSDRYWSIDNSIREVLQNTIDGAKEYWMEHSKDGISSIRPLFFSPDSQDDPWQVKETLMSPRGFKQYKCYTSTLILVPDGCTLDELDRIRKNKRLDTSNVEKNKKGIEKWDDSDKVLAFIQLTYAVEKMKWDRSKLTYGQIPGSILIKLVAENRAVEELQNHMHSFFTTGGSNKGNNDALAGMHGEGLKVGINRLVYFDYNVTIEANGIKRKYVHKKVGNTKTLHAVHDNPHTTWPMNIVTVSISVNEDCKHGFIFSWMSKVDHSTFQLLNPGKEPPKEGEILVDKVYQGHIFCQGIRIEKCPTSDVVFGYSIPKNMIKTRIGRDRNSIPWDTLRWAVSELWKNLQDAPMRLLVEYLQNSESPNNFVEFEILNDTDNKILAEKFVQEFKLIEGADAFPCLSTELKDATKILAHKKILPMTPGLVHFFREHGGYNNVEQELETFYNRSNPSRLNINSDKYLQELIRCTLLCLNSVIDDSSDKSFKLETEESESTDDSNFVFFIDGSRIGDANDVPMCKCIGNVFFVHDSLLHQNTDTADAAYTLGYHIAMNVNRSFQIKYGCNGRKVLDKESTCCPISAKEIDSGDGSIRICLDFSEELAQKSPSIRITNTKTGEKLKILKLSSDSKSLLAPSSSDIMRRNMVYLFEAFEAYNPETDVASGKYCECTHETKDYSEEEKTKLCSGITKLKEIYREWNNRSEHDRAHSDDSDDNVVDSNYSDVELHSDSGSVSDNNGNASIFLNDHYMPDISSDRDMTASSDSESEDDGEMDDESLDELWSTTGFSVGTDLSVDTNFVDSEDDENEVTSPKRQKTCCPSEQNFFENIQGHRFSRDSWYRHSEDHSLYCKIIRFGGKTRVTRITCNVRKMFHLTWAGSDDCKKYVECRELNRSTRWLGQFTSSPVNVVDLPKPKWLYTERAPGESFKDQDLICHYELLKRSDDDDSSPRQSFLEKPRLCESFAGVGGMSEGLKRAGMNVSVLIEKDPLAA